MLHFVIDVKHIPVCVSAVELAVMVKSHLYTDGNPRGIMFCVLSTFYAKVHSCSHLDESQHKKNSEHNNTMTLPWQWA